VLILEIDENRLEFVRFWAKYVKERDPAIWSKQQKELIDSVIKTALQDVELYLKVKKISKEVKSKIKRQK